MSKRILAFCMLLLSVTVISSSSSEAGNYAGDPFSSWSFNCPNFPDCTLDATFQVSMSPGEVFIGTYQTTAGFLGCLNPNLFNVASGNGGIETFMGVVSLSGALQTDERGKTFLEQAILVAAPEFAAFCMENPGDPICQDDDGTGTQALEKAWNVGEGSGNAECNNQWTSYVVFPTRFVLTGHLVQLKTCSDPLNPTVMSCTSRKPKTSICSSNEELRNLIDDITDVAEVIYTCVDQ